MPTRAQRIIEQARALGINPTLENFKRFCDGIDSPQERYSCVQVGGTNGKSSTARYLAAILQQHGLGVGLYTSPELVRLNERIEIRGQVITDDDLERSLSTLASQAKKWDIQLSEFELFSAVALTEFAVHAVDYAVLEVGLGGRWDATSVVLPRLAILTGVDFDHTQILGSTIKEIARDKAAIIKPGTTVVLADTRPEALDIFQDRARAVGATVVLATEELGNVALPSPARLFASYQRANQSTALTAARALLKSDFVLDVAQNALRDTVIPGRFETVCEQPLVIIDAAHNPQALAVLMTALVDAGLLPPFSASDASFRTPPILLLALLADKDAEAILAALEPYEIEVAVTQTASPRALGADALASIVASRLGYAPLTFATSAEALDALIPHGRPIIACGSITLAGEVKRRFAPARHSDKMSQTDNNR
jgi:dihydrofolate synthase/folylpolyglutamate synthase